MKAGWLMFLLPLVLSADSITLKRGETVRGIVRTIEGGKVVLESDGQSRNISILDVQTIDFDTPHFSEGTSTLSAEHFAGGLDPKEMERLGRDGNRLHQQLHSLLDQVQAKWKDRGAIDAAQAQQWAAEKERFGAPLAAYRKSINELFQHAAVEVDRYNTLAKTASGFYVGVKGIFNTGSALIPPEQKELSVKEMLPGHWYETIYFDAYSKGFRDAKEFDALTPR